jgi:hypothetical protein
MTPTDAAAAVHDAVVNVPSHFMLDMATYAKGAELGFSGLDFYVAGRGGALGEVHGEVVAAAFVFFEPANVVVNWESGRRVMGPREAAIEFARVGWAWADEHLSDDVDHERLAALLADVVAGTAPAGAPLFAAWREQPEPGDSRPKAQVLHRLNLLRELRGGLHAGAVLAAGFTPLEAVMAKTPGMAPIFGWSEPYPSFADRSAEWQVADRATDVAFGLAALAHLDEAGRRELVGLGQAVAGAVS